jgi:hypothetical protein
MFARGYAAYLISKKWAGGFSVGLKLCPCYKAMQIADSDRAGQETGGTNEDDGGVGMFVRSQISKSRSGAPQIVAGEVAKGKARATAGPSACLACNRHDCTPNFAQDDSQSLCCEL